MLRTAKIIQPNSFTGEAMGKDMTEAILMSVDEATRPQLKSAIEGRFVYLAKLILDYHKSISGADWMAAQAAARNQLETIADDMAEDLDIANSMPSDDESFPQDHAGLFNLLTIADNRLQFNPNAFDTGKINRWMDLLAADDVATVRGEMIDSGQFTSEQRYRNFIDRTKNTMEFYEDLARERVAEKAGKEELRMQQPDAPAAKEMAPEVDLQSLDPALRTEIEMRENEKADWEAKQKEKDRIRTDFYKGTMAPDTGIPGLNAFLDDLWRVVTKTAPDDEEARMNLVHFSEAVKDHAKTNPENWEAGISDVMRGFPSLVDFVDDMQRRVDEKAYAAEQRIRPPHRAPEEMTPESQKSDLGLDVSSALINKNQEFDAMRGEGPWEVDAEAKAIRRRKIMVQNAIFGRPPVPFAIGDRVGFSRGLSLDAGKILAIKADHYVIESASGQTEVAHDSVFEPTSSELF